MRSLRYAFAASILAHLLLLWPRVSVVEVKDTPMGLQATIIDPAPAVSPAPTLSPSIESQRLKPPIRPVAPNHPVPPAPTVPAIPAHVAAPDSVPQRQDILAAKEQSAPVSVPAAIANEAPASMESSSVGPPARPAPGMAAATAPATVLAGKPTASALSKDDLHRYRLALASQARRFKLYPAQAKTLGWTGTAELRIDVDRNGRSRTPLLVRSSGHEALDRAALAMIEAGAQRARLPDGLMGREFSVTLPVVFNLEDE